MGASKSGNSPSSMSAIFTIRDLQNYGSIADEYSLPKKM
jgi:hypothetical protein